MHRHNVILLSLLTFTGLVFTACSSSDGTDGTNGAKALIAIADEPAGSNCESGGKLITSGLDSNRNNVLDANEISSSEYICNGESGNNALVTTTPFSGEQFGCQYGGVTLDVGNDSNNNGLLDQNEITQTTHLCHNLSAPPSFTFAPLEESIHYNIYDVTPTGEITPMDITIPLDIVLGDKSVTVEAALDNDLMSVTDANTSRVLLTPKAGQYGSVNLTVTALDELGLITHTIRIDLLRPVPKTGKSSYGSFDDGWYQRGVAHNTSLYTSKVVFDHLSGQMWSNVVDGSCVSDICEGGLHDGANCSSDTQCLNAIEEENFDMSVPTNSCESLSLDGFSDWTLPTTTQLQLLMDGGLPTLFQPFETNDNMIGFDGHPVFIAKEALMVGDTGLTFSVTQGFEDPFTGELVVPKISTLCVRNQESPSGPSYSITPDNLLIDNQTGLSWTDELAHDTLHSISDYRQYCQDLVTIQHGDWRLPNLNEILSITDWERFRVDQNIAVSDTLATSSADLYTLPSPFGLSPIYLIKKSENSETILAFSTLPNTFSSGLRCVRGGEKAGVGPIYGGGLIGDSSCILGSTIDLGTPTFYQPDEVEITSVTFNNITSPYLCDTLGDFTYSATAVDTDGKEGSSPEYTITVERDTPHYSSGLIMIECLMGEEVSRPVAEFTHSDPTATWDVTYSIDDPYLCPDIPDFYEGVYDFYHASATDNYGMVGQSPEFEIYLINPRPMYIGGVIEALECQQTETIDGALVGQPEFDSMIGANIVDSNLSISFPFDCNREPGVYTYHASATDNQGNIGVSPDFTITVFGTEPFYTEGLQEYPECRAMDNPVEIGTPEFWLPAVLSITSLELIYNESPTGSSEMSFQCVKNSDNLYMVRAHLSDGSSVDTPQYDAIGVNSEPQYVSGLDKVWCRGIETITRTILFDDADNDPLAYYLERPVLGVILSGDLLEVNCLDHLDATMSTAVTANDGEVSSTPHEVDIGHYYQTGLVGDTTCRTDALPLSLGDPDFLLPDGVTITKTELFVNDTLQGEEMELTSCVKDETWSYYAQVTYSDGTTARSPSYTITGENSLLVYVSGIDDVLCNADETINMEVILNDTDHDFVTYTFNPNLSALSNSETNITVDCSTLAYASTQEVLVSAYDETESTDLPSFFIDKGDNDRPLYISGISDVDCSDNAIHTMTVVASDDEGEAISFTLDPEVSYVTISANDTVSAQIDIDCTAVASGANESYDILADDGYNGPASIRNFTLFKP